MKLDDDLTEGITATWKVAVDLLLLDSTILSLDDNDLRLRSKVCAALGSMRKHHPYKGCGPNHRSVASAGTNCLLSGLIESAGEGIKKSLEQIVRTLNESMSKPPGATVTPLRFN